jgi:BMFP domain-containing protein YqiC
MSAKRWINKKLKTRRDKEKNLEQRVKALETEVEQLKPKQEAK